MAEPFNNTDVVRETYFIDESERDTGTPANDVGKVVQLEADGYLSEQFIRAASDISSQVSDNVRHTNAPERNTTSGSYVKLKETEITGDSIFKARFKVAGYHTVDGGSGGGAYVAFYVNGVKVSGDLTPGLGIGAYVTVSYDHTGELKAGDLVQVYARRVNNYPAVYVKDFSICFDSSVSKFFGIELDTPLIGLHEGFSAAANASY